MDKLDDSIQDRNMSSRTVASDSGVSSILNEDGVREVETTVDANANENVEAIPNVRRRQRISMDEHGHNRMDLSRLMEVNVRSRRSCSLPDILDFGDVDEWFDDNLDTSLDSPHSCAGSSKDSLSVAGTEEARTISTVSEDRLQLCGKNHIEKPCYICLKDNELYCNVCVKVHNFHCAEKVKHIPEIPPEMRTNLCDEALKELNVMKERFDKVKTENEVFIEQLKESRKKYVRSVTNYKNDIFEVIDKLEKNALSQMDIIYNKEKNKINENLETLEREIANIKGYLTNIEQRNMSNENSIVYELQASTEQLRLDDTLIRDLHKSTSLVQFEFEPLVDLLSMLSDFDSLWKVEKRETVTCTYPRPCTCDRSYRYKVAARDTEISARLSGWSFDRERCCITGCEFLPNGKLLLCDNGNKKLKLFDKKFKCVSAHSVSSMPWDVAVIDKNRAVVTVPDRKKLQFIEVNRKISFKDSVTLQKNCWGISHSNGELFVTCWSRDSKEVVILDLEGTPTRRIITVQSQPFHTPWFIDGHNDTLLVSDWGTYIVQSVTTSGIAIFKYRNSNLVAPLGMARDPEENVYICGRDSNNIHQLSRDGTVHRIFLSEKDGISQPLNISHRVADDTLVVTSWMSDKICVFTLH